MAKNSLSIRKENKSRRHGQRERWKQKTEFVGGDGLMAPFSTRKEGMMMMISFCPFNHVLIGFQATFITNKSTKSCL